VALTPQYDYRALEHFFGRSATSVTHLECYNSGTDTPIYHLLANYNVICFSSITRRRRNFPSEMHPCNVVTLFQALYFAASTPFTTAAVLQQSSAFPSATISYPDRFRVEDENCNEITLKSITISPCRSRAAWDRNCNEVTLVIMDSVRYSAFSTTYCNEITLFKRYMAI
jgi:hypothetical protein